MDLSVEQLQRQFDTGPVACLRTMQACYPHLKGRDGARVINFASSVGIKGTAGFAPYAMAKEAIRGLTRVAACDVVGAEAQQLIGGERKSVVEGRSVSVGVCRGCRRIIKKTTLTT